VLTEENDSEGELADLFWSIVNSQNAQITFMEKWLLDNGRHLHKGVGCAQCPTGCSPIPRRNNRRVTEVDSQLLTSLLFGASGGRSKHQGGCPAGCERDEK
jgi:hypothetical protein